MRAPRTSLLLLALASLAVAPLAADPALQRLLAGAPLATATVEPAVETQRLGEADLLLPVGAQVATRWSVDPESLRLQARAAWRGPQVIPGAYQIEVHTLSAQTPAASVVVRGVVSQEGRVLAEFSMPFSCELPRPVLVATRRINRGEALDPNAFQVQTVDALRLPATAIDPEADLGGLELLLPVKPGQALTLREVGERPLVRKGAVVEVQVQRGPLNIRTQALALENGRAGEFISLRNLQSRRDFKAEVIHENQVRIRL